MARKFADLKFTGLERASIEIGYGALEDVAARTGSTSRAYLAKALKLETTGRDAVATLFAKGLLCQWFRDAGSETVAGLYGRREASILVSIMAHAACEATHRPSQVQLDAIANAALAKQRAFSRYSETA